MRFWRSFHAYSIEIISDSPNKLVFRAPKYVRLRMSVDHIESSKDPGSYLTHYNHDTYLWECYHSPCTTGHHRLFIWLLDIDYDDQWVIAVRFDVFVEQELEPYIYPITTNTFNSLLCQLISPINGVLLKESLPSEILIRVPSVHDVQLQADEETLIAAKYLENDIYKVEIPPVLSKNVKNFTLMALCYDDTYYSILVTYKIT